MNSLLLLKDHALRITGLGLKTAGSGAESGCPFVILLSHLAAVPRGELLDPLGLCLCKYQIGLLRCLNVIALSKSGVRFDDYMGKKTHAKCFAQC